MTRAADRMTGTLLVTPLTPLHVGSGEVFTPMDYALRHGRFEVKDVARFFQDNRASVEYALDAVANGLPLGPEYVRYRLPYFGDGPRRNLQGPAPAPAGPRSHQDRSDVPFNPAFAGLAPAPKEAQQKTPPPPRQTTPAPARRGGGRSAPEPAPEPTVGEVRAFIKDPFGLPFLPGSSVKGALRSAIAWSLARHVDLDKAVQDAIADKRARKEWVSDPVVKKLFGDGPLNDLLKAFHVGDSPPLALEAHFAVCQVTIMNVTPRGFIRKDTPIHLESLMPSAGPVKIPLRVDLYRLANDESLRHARSGKGANLLRDKAALEAALKDYSKDLLQYEADFYKKQRASAVLPFVENLLKSGQTVLPIGFGTGWHAKTLGRRLSPAVLLEVRKRFSTDPRGRHTKAMGTRGVELFPKTRKWARTPQGDRPLGWCKVEILWD